MCCLVTVGQCDQQGFNFVFGSDGSEECHAVDVLPGGDVIVVGTTNGAGQGQKDWLVTRFDSAGDMIWSKSVGTSWNEGSVYSCCRVDETGIYIGGTTQLAVGSTGVWVILKLDNDGELQWSKELANFSSVGDAPRGMIHAANGDLLISGTTNSFGEGSSDAVLLRMDISGNVLWCKSLGTPNAARNDHLLSLVELPNGNIVYAGNSESWYNSNADQPWLVEYSSTGTYIQEHVLVSSLVGASSDITYDGAYIYFCASLSNSRSVFVCKITLDYELVWQRNLIGTGDWIAPSIKLTTENDLVVTQQGEWQDNNSNDFLSFGLSAAGDLMWSSLVENPSTQFPGVYPHNLGMSSDGHLYIANQTNGFDLPSSEIQFVKLDACGQNGCEQDLEIELDETEFSLESVSNDEQVIDAFSDWECTVADVTSLVNTDEICEPCELEVDVNGRTLCAGEAWQPEAEILDGNEADADWNWTVSDGQTFDVFDPTITFDEEGTFEINVTATLGGCEGMATTLVLVYPAMVVTINQDGNLLTASQGAFYQWYLNGELIEGATSMGYMMLEDGVYTVVVTDIHGCTGEESVDAILTSVMRPDVISGISVYPNPASESIQVAYSNPEKLEVYLYNSLGEVVHKAVLLNELISVDVRHFPPGAYHLTFRNPQGCLERKTVIIRR
jgi:hypothetical protein